MYGISNEEMNKIIEISKKIEENNTGTETEILLDKLLKFTREMKDDLILSNKKEIYTLNKEVEIIKKENVFLKKVKKELENQNNFFKNELITANNLIETLRETLTEVLNLLDKIDLKNSLKRFKKLNSLFQKTENIDIKTEEKLNKIKEEKENFEKIKNNLSENLKMIDKNETSIEVKHKNKKYHLGQNFDELN